MNGCVGIVAAMEAEIAPLVRGWRRHTIEHDGEEIVLFESQKAVAAVGGMGWKNATLAAKALVDEKRCMLLLSVGLAGGLTSHLKVGDVVEPALVVSETSGANFQIASGKGTLVTAERISSSDKKRMLAEKYSADAVDMEAAAVAEVAAKANVPFRAVKAISDSLEFPMPDMNRFVGTDGRFATAKFVLHTLLRPGSWAAVAQLARNSSLAARNLCARLEHLIDNEIAAADAINLKES